MFRGCRWQLIALILALVLFLAGALFRLSRGASRPQAAAPTPTTGLANAATPRATQSARPTASGIAVPEADSEPAISSPAAYREGLVGAVQRLNPLYAHLNPVDRDISSLIFEGLFATNEYGEAAPRLAEQLVISADGIEYVVSLRQDALWHDGVAFGADDVVYTMSLLSDPDYASISPLGEFWVTVETQKLSEQLIRFRLAQPLSSFPHLLTIGILPEHALRGTTLAQLAQHPFNLSPIGTGPYQLAELRAGEANAISAVELARAPVFMDRQGSTGSYALARLSFNLYANAQAALDAYASGVVNALANVARRDRLLQLPRSRVYTQIAPSIAMLIFNWEEAPFGERRLRQALSLSLDLPDLIQRHLGADATYADSPYSASASVYLPHPFWHSQDVAQARALLDAAGLYSSGDGEAETNTESTDPGAEGDRLSLLIEDRGALQDLAAEIAAHWGQLNIEVQIEAVAPADLTSRLATGRFQMAILELPVGADFDLYRNWHPAQFGQGQNFGAAANHEVADLIERIRGEVYPNRRGALYQQLQEEFAEQAIAMPLYYPLYTFVVGEQFDGVRIGYLASPADRFRAIGDWRMATETS